MGTYVAMHFVAKIIKWLLILSAYYCPSLCVYKLHLATLGMDYLSIAIILFCGSHLTTLGMDYLSVATILLCG